MALDHYEVERADDTTPVTDSTAPSGFVYIGKTVKKEYTDVNVKPNNAYWYRVFAVDTFGIRSSPSKPVYVSLADPIHAEPTNLVATYVAFVPTDPATT